MHHSIYLPVLYIAHEFRTMIPIFENYMKQKHIFIVITFQSLHLDTFNLCEKILLANHVTSFGTKDNLSWFMVFLHGQPTAKIIFCMDKV